MHIPFFAQKGTRSHILLTIVMCNPPISSPTNDLQLRVSVPCADLKGLHTVISNVIRGSTFTCFSSVILADHADCPSASSQCKTVTLIFFFSILLKAADGTASPASLHDDLMKKLLRSWRYLMCHCGLQLLLSLL